MAKTYAYGASRRKGRKHTGYKGANQTGIVHRQYRIDTTGSAGSAVATLFAPFGPGALRAIKVDYHASAPATTDLVLKADSSSGTTIFTAANTATDIPPRAVGSPNAVDEGRAVTAATDATDGGAFFTEGIYIDIAQSDALTNAVVLDLWVDTCDLIDEKLRPTGSAGSASINRTIPMNRAGVIRGIAIDFGSGVPATTDVVIKADDTNGETLFSSANSTTDFGSTSSGVALGIIGVDEANGALAATDGSSGGQPFRRAIRVEVAQADPYVDATDEVRLLLWVE